MLLGAILVSKAIGQEHIWLHTDGKYIRTSSAANPPNEIWMGCGVAWRADLLGNDQSRVSGMADWLKDNGVNLIRYAKTTDRLYRRVDSTIYSYDGAAINVRVLIPAYLWFG